MRIEMYLWSFFTDNIFFLANLHVFKIFLLQSDFNMYKFDYY